MKNPIVLRIGLILVAMVVIWLTGAVRFSNSPIRRQETTSQQIDANTDRRTIHLSQSGGLVFSPILLLLIALAVVFLWRKIGE